MPRNIEIKARVDSVEAMMPRAQALADGPSTRIEQDDTFFNCTQGRLKLRDFGDGRGELIHYQRADTAGPKVSDYVRTPSNDPAALREALARAHGVLGRVHKVRLLFMVGQTRIHLDRVQGLGDFMELEVVLRNEQSIEEGEAIAQMLMQQLGVMPAQRLAGAYLDLLSPPAIAADKASVVSRSKAP